MRYYYEINWDATANNVRTLIDAQGWDKQTSKQVLAEVFACCERNIDSLLSANTRLSIPHLMYFARYCGVDMSDLIVINGDQQFLADEIAKKRLSDSENIATHNTHNNNATQKDICISDLATEVAEMTMLNEIAFRGAVLHDLKRFLLYLPLLEPRDLKDFIIRIQGNLSPRDESYFCSQLGELYASIPASAAKRYADSISYYELDMPSVCYISGSTSNDDAKRKIEAWKDWSASSNTRLDYIAYKHALNTFMGKI